MWQVGVVDKKVGVTLLISGAATSSGRTLWRCVVARRRCCCSLVARLATVTTSSRSRIALASLVSHVLVLVDGVHQRVDPRGDILCCVLQCLGCLQQKCVPLDCDIVSIVGVWCPYVVHWSACAVLWCPLNYLSMSCVRLPYACSWL